MSRIRAFWSALHPNWQRFVIAMAASIFSMLFGAVLARFGLPAPTLPPIPVDPIFSQPGGQGWVDDPEAVKVAAAQIAIKQGMPIEFSKVAQNAIAGDDNKDSFLWRAEETVLGKRLGSWDQGPIGTCVSFGWGRGAQDVLLGNIADGAAEEWKSQVATEPIYGGSRVEVGGGRIRGDGSVGAWAARWCSEWGMLFRQQYGDIDLSAYSVEISRTWGYRGVPNALEPEAKKFPLTVAQVQSASDVWAAIGNGYSVPVCSNVGFDGKPPATGVMEPRGSWGHCMVFRGRFTHPTIGRCIVVQNSWGNYLGAVAVETVESGRVELPEGCFAIRLDVAGRMAAQGDTFAISGAKGFPKRRKPWFTQDKKPAADWSRPFFAIAI